ncbi:signal recognition particle-docking protein FtsY [Vagococcus fessus]|uniref:Signal recognition particle receptor FtsY n=1 Tax=Vagococcus fessus TaxID=120370 RepID=A0A430A652_9ENTE|nr:signal recognition particle-docking protein FtsY [Vagococcus fessus]RSU02359.1 signal recognition particle-docking protein FtsY [Vagococcus fessus]
MGFFKKIKKAFGGNVDEPQTPEIQEEEVVEVEATEPEAAEEVVEVETTEPEAAEEVVEVEATEPEAVEEVVEVEATEPEPEAVEEVVEVETTEPEAAEEVVEVEATEPEAVEEVVEVEATEPEAVEEVLEVETTEPEAAEEVVEVETTEPEPEKEETSESEESSEKMAKGLKKTRRTFSQVFNELLSNFRKVDEDFFEELEETLITADVGFETAMRITEDLRKEVKLQNAKKQEDVQRVIIDKLVEVYEEQGQDENNEINLQKDELTVMLFVGVNGVGKTTSIGKLANQYRLEGKKVLMAAADTFRAGAIDQLVVWGERAQVEVVRGNAGGDPAAVVYDAIEQAKAQEADVLLVDTAGRLQNKVNLMNELEKIKRIIQREIPDAPHEVLLVLDATTGQNAMVQAKQFKEVTDVTGLVLTKLDGTAKGGIVLAIRNELHLPVKLVGLGEGLADLYPFKPEEYVQGLFKGLMD